MTAGPASTGGVPPPSDQRTHSTFAWFAVGAGGATALGAALEAESASAYGLSASRSFVDRNAGGVIVLILGFSIVGVAIALGLGAVPRWGGWLVAGLGGVAALVSLLNLVDIADNVDKFSDVVRRGGASVGVATPVCLVAGIAAATFGVLASALRPNT
jgi:hypothetical protein